MIILAVLASLVAIGALCYLLFTLAIYAVPFFAGMATANWAYGTGAGLLGAIIVGLVGGVATFLAIQLLLVTVRPLWLRVLIALAFVVPSVIAGYHATHAIRDLADRLLGDRCDRGRRHRLCPFDSDRAGRTRAGQAGRLIASIRCGGCRNGIVRCAARVSSSLDRQVFQR